MTLRQRLFLSYSLLAGLCVLLMAALSYHEFILVPRVRAEAGIPAPLSPWGEDLKLILHALVPVVLLGGWLFMRRTLNPVGEFAANLECLHAGTLGQTLPRSGNGDEIDRLVGVFNDMTCRLDKTFKHAREFALHAAHELKTPLAVMRSEYEAKRTDADVPSFCRTCAETRLVEIDRLAQMVDSLTLLSKADVGMIAIEHKLVLLPDLICESYDDTRILGEFLDIEVSIAACETAIILGDRNRIRQLLLNLADNAVKYNKPGGSITFSLRVVDDQAEIVITNTGAGIPPELAGHEFERFVRGPEARERAVEGCGLGLAICEWIVNAHGGVIKLASDANGLTTATVRIPALP